MFYTVKNNKINAFADFKFDENCFETTLCSREEFLSKPQKFLLDEQALVLNPNYDDIQKNIRKECFEAEFFSTSLGYIRRKVTMKDGSQKDFLTDLLPSIKLGLETETDVKVIVYRKPDFTQELTTDYMVTLQEIKQANMDFVKECLTQTMQDFGGV